ncbi:outer membrane protein, partial [Sphingomonas mucosissima]|uniref:outer membrane protein n=1 Tax=Sphingomonas mucosissima TaxID=370959 RepID=UPI001124F9FC
MRKLAVVLALASTALASPALARDNAWYVGAEFGGMIVEDIEFDITGTQSGRGTIDHDYGFDGDGVVGYDFGGFRLEAEVAYKQASVDSYTSTVVVPAGTGAGVVNVAPGTFDGAGGRSTALSFMVNGMLDFGDDDGIQGFIGGGAGVARIKNRVAINQRGSFLNDSDTVFAWQGIAGVRAPLTENIDATLKYRFFNASNVELVDFSNRAYEGRFRSHSILGGGAGVARIKNRVAINQRGSFLNDSDTVFA